MSGWRELLPVRGATGGVHDQEELPDGGDSVAMGIYHNEMEAWGGCQTQLVVGLNAAMEKGCWNVTSLSQLHQNNLQVLVI